MGEAIPIGPRAVPALHRVADEARSRATSNRAQEASRALGAQVRVGTGERDPWLDREVPKPLIEVEAAIETRQVEQPGSVAGANSRTEPPTISRPDRVHLLN